MIKDIFIRLYQKIKSISLLKLIKRFVLSLAVIIIGSYLFVEMYSLKRTFDKSEIDDIPHNKIGLLLGTAKHLGSRINLYYQYRIEAAVELYNKHKIDYILISGDNGRHTYNEPMMMKEDLIQRGVPENKIILDYAGFRTLDSVVRCEKVFGETKITIISQEFHNERALFVAYVYGIEAYGFNAKNVSKRYGTYTSIREVFARVKLMIDIIIGKSPKYLGEKIQIGG